MIGGISAQGVILISFINDKRRAGLGLREAVIEAAPLRLRPILMTRLPPFWDLCPWPLPSLAVCFSPCL
ncbi:MAG: efflux RND transporter permease subunit [Acidobacteriota bacterium]